MAQLTNPMVGWVLDKTADIDGLVKDLAETVVRKAPHLSGHLYLTQPKGKKNPNRPGFGIEYAMHSTTLIPTVLDRLKWPLSSLVPTYVPDGHPHPEVRCADLLSLSGRHSVFRSLAHFNEPATIAARKSGRSMGLHVVQAKDHTLLCLAWRGVAMDAYAMTELMVSWRLVAKEKPPKSTGEKARKMSRSRELIEAFERLIAQREDGVDDRPEGWSSLAMSDLHRLMLPPTQGRTGDGALDVDDDALVPGVAYVPKAIVDSWYVEAAKQLDGDEAPTPSDVLTAWFYKTAWGIYEPSTPTTLAPLFNLRGKHPFIPQIMQGNLSSFAVLPSMSAGDLASTPIGTLVRSVRDSAKTFQDPAAVKRLLAFVADSIDAGRVAVPGTDPARRLCLVSSRSGPWIPASQLGDQARGAAVLGLVNLNPTSLLSVLEMDRKGGARAWASLPRRAWDAIKQALEQDAARTQARGKKTSPSSGSGKME